MNGMKSRSPQAFSGSLGFLCEPWASSAAVPGRKRTCMQRNVFCYRIIQHRLLGVVESSCFSSSCNWSVLKLRLRPSNRKSPRFREPQDWPVCATRLSQEGSGFATAAKYALREASVVIAGTAQCPCSQSIALRAPACTSLMQVSTSAGIPQDPQRARRRHRGWHASLGN